MAYIRGEGAGDDVPRNVGRTGPEDHLCGVIGAFAGRLFMQARVPFRESLPLAQRSRVRGT